MTVNAKVLGVDELTSTMHKAGEALAAMDSAHGKASAMIASAAAAAAPRRSGRLASSVRAGKGGGKGTVDVTAAYAGPIHWGWPSRHIDPQPFAMNAARATEPQWIKFYEEETQKALDGVKGT
jgi:HK97 gp10 family phage protein